MSISAVMLSLCLAACTSGSKLAGDFGEKTLALSSAIESAAQLDIDIETKTNLKRAATIYASGRKVDFPQKGVFVAVGTDADWEARRELIKALKAYSAGLIAVSDPELVASAVAAADSLSVALGNFEAAQALRIRDAAKREIAVAEAERTRTLGGVIVAIGGTVVQLGVEARLSQIIRENDGLVVGAAEALKKDLAVVEGSIHLKRNRYVNAVSDQLDLQRVDRTLSSRDKIAIYEAAVAEIDNIDARIAVVGETATAIDAMKKAHAKLAAGTVTADDIQAFALQVSRIADKIAALQKAEEKIVTLKRP